MGKGALAIGPKLPRPSSTLPKCEVMRVFQYVRFAPRTGPRWSTLVLRKSAITGSHESAEYLVASDISLYALHEPKDPYISLGLRSAGDDAGGEKFCVGAVGIIDVPRQALWLALARIDRRRPRHASAGSLGIVC
jgi:hypothetical protein